jgi:hypothetical protein
VAEHREHGDAWFVSEGFMPHEEVVATGGQLLLSEELRQRMPEDRDD